MYTSIHHAQIRTNHWYTCVPMMHSNYDTYHTYNIKIHIHTHSCKDTNIQAHMPLRPNEHTQVTHRQSEG